MAILLGIVDDRLVNRDTVKGKLANYAEIKVCMEAASGGDFLDYLKSANTLPDVVLMDLEMPGKNGIETIQLASVNYPSIKFIVLTVFEDSAKIFEAIKAGAHGYLLKNDKAIEIVDAIINVHEHGGIPMSPIIARKAMELLRHAPLKTAAVADVALSTQEDTVNLSSREMDVLNELVTGKNYQFIGEKLFISPQTVRKHVANIYEKLHVNSRTQLLNIAHKKKWI